MKCILCHANSELVTEDFTSYGVTVKSSFWKCLNKDCETTWLSAKQEADVDMAIKSELRNKLQSVSDSLDGMLSWCDDWKLNAAQRCSVMEIIEFIKND